MRCTTLVNALAVCAMFATVAVAELDPATLAQKLSQGAPLLGTFQSTDGPMTRWMSNVSDNTPLQNVNIPGTHDSAAWNDQTPILKEWVNTQERPLFEQLDDGIRFLDLRIGMNGDRISLYHGPTLLSDTTVLDDVLWGLYYWLDNHPTEMLFVSIKVDSGQTSVDLQNAVMGLYTGTPGSQYWYQDLTMLPTLGAARKKLILIRRFSLDNGVPAFGCDFSSWPDNEPSFTVDYFSAQTAWVEDMYMFDSSYPTLAAKVAAKLNATTANVDRARADSALLYISFASGSGVFAEDNVTPHALAVGDGAGVSGMNSQLLSYLRPFNGTKGVLLLDFYNSEPDLVAEIAGVAPPTTPTRTPPADGSSGAGGSGARGGTSGSMPLAPPQLLRGLSFVIALSAVMTCMV